MDYHGPAMGFMRFIRIFCVLLSVAWVLFVGVHYITHNVSLSPKLNQYLFILLYALVLRSFGQRIQHLLGIPPVPGNKLSGYIIDIALGLGAGNTVLYLALLLVPQPRFMAPIVFALIALYCMADIKDSLLSLFLVQGRIDMQGLRKREIYLFLVVMLAVVTLLILCHAPAVDPLVLRGSLNEARQWLSFGRPYFRHLVFPPFELVSALPFLSLFPDQTIGLQIFNTLLLVLTAFLFYHIIYADAKERRAIGLMGQLSFITIPIVMYMALIPGSIPQNLLYITALIYFYRRKAHIPRTAAASAMSLLFVCIGLSARLGLVYLAILLVYFLLDRTLHVRIFAGFLTALVLYAGQFLLHARLLAGLDALCNVRDIASRAVNMLRLPVNLSLYGRLATGYLPIGPLFLIALPFVLACVLKKSQRIRLLFCGTVFALLVLFVRFSYADFIPALLFVTLVCADYLFPVLTKNRFLCFMVVTLLVLIALFNLLSLLQWHIDRFSPLPVIVGNEQFAHYIHRYLPTCRPLQQAAHLVEDNAVLMGFEHLPLFYQKQPYVMLDASIDIPATARMFAERGRAAYLVDTTALHDPDYTLKARVGTVYVYRINRVAGRRRP